MISSRTKRPSAFPESLHRPHLLHILGSLLRPVSCLLLSSFSLSICLRTWTHVVGFISYRNGSIVYIVYSHFINSVVFSDTSVNWESIELAIFVLANYSSSPLRSRKNALDYNMTYNSTW